ncbi:MAG: hypothetical protein IJ189_04735 [Clostridia bacterium]|nr:hypothetical protein [Clostridia bacterium]
MTIQPVVKQETKKIAVGVLVLTLLMIAVFLIIRKFDYTVLLGALLGSAAAIGNFFLMALSVQKAADSMRSLPPASQEAPSNGEEAEESEETEAPLSDDAKKAKKRMQASYSLRMLMMAVIAVIGVALPCFNSYAALIPMLFPRIVIFLIGMIQKNQKEA